MSKSATFKGIAVIAIVCIISFSVWDSQNQVKSAKQRLLPAVTTYQTSSVRTNNVVKYCAGLDRNNLVSFDTLSAAKTNRQTVQSQLGIEGNKLINNLIKSKYGDALSMVTGNVVNMAIFFAVFLLPMVIFMSIWPCLCCCCCCPSCCPSKCCQKPEDQAYSKCELFWPAVTLILGLLLTLSTGIYGFINSSNVGSTFSSIGCGVSIFTDDLMNGNVTTNGTFFTGLNVFSSSLASLLANIDAMNTQMNDLSNTASGTTYTLVQNIQTVQTSIKNLPDNAGTGPMALNYNIPINSGAPTVGGLGSSFSSILGWWSASGTYVQKLYTSVVAARASMQLVKTNSNTFSGQVANIKSGITPMKTTIDNLIADVKNMDDGLGGFLSLLSYPKNFGNIGMQGFYGFLIAFSFFAILGALLTACCDKPGCRHLMYFSCIFLFIGGFIAFWIAVIFSIFVPIFTWTCSFLDVTIGSDAGFRSNFDTFLSANTIDQISVCMPFGDGVIVNKVGGSATTGLNSLTTVISNLKSFNNATLQGYISGNLTALTTMINAYANGDISDLDAANNNILLGISDPTNTTNKASCTTISSGTTTKFSLDSWVPSNNQNYSYSTAISCQVSSGNTGTKVSCASSIPGACSGCMDTSQLFTLRGTKTDIQNDLIARYGAGCVFATTMGNIWQNYYDKRYTILGYPNVVGPSPAGSVKNRLSTLTTAITDTTVATSVFKSLDNFRSQLNTLSNNLGTISSSLTDPTYGMLAGLNCRLFGQDFQTFQNIMCGSLYNNMFMIRMTFGLAGWGILFGMCCIVCTGVRHYKQVDKMKKISDGNFMREAQDEGTKNKLHNTKQ